MKYLTLTKNNEVFVLSNANGATLFKIDKFLTQQFHNEELELTLTTKRPEFGVFVKDEEEFKTYVVKMNKANVKTDDDDDTTIESLFLGKKKYRLLKNDTIEFCGKTLYRIEALKNFADVKKGDKGGYIENESNLYQYDNAWVYDYAKVSGNVIIYHYAKVSGHAEVTGDVEIAGCAKVTDYAKVSGNVKIRANAEVSGEAEVSGYVVITGEAKITGFAKVSGYGI